VFTVSNFNTPADLREKKVKIVTDDAEMYYDIAKAEWEPQSNAK
jgi:hypothetical protein